MAIRAPDGANNDDDDNVWLVVPAHCIIETHGAAERAAGEEKG